MGSGAAALILTSVSPLTTELLAPAMTRAAQSVGYMWVEGSTSLYFGVMSVLHLFHGALTGRVGVTAVAGYGCVVYALACLSVAQKTGPSFAVSRALQAVGASACSVSGFALIRSHLRPSVHIHVVNAARATLLIVAPMVAQTVVASGKWRDVFWCMLVPVLLALPIVLGLGCIPRNNGAPHHRQVRTGRGYTLFGVWVFVDALGFASMLVWVAYAPFVAAQTGADPAAFGYLYGATFSGSVVGPLLALWMSPTLPVVLMASTIASVAACALWIDVPSAMYTGMALSNLCRSFAASHVQSEVLRTGPVSPGLTAGIAHSARMLVASAVIAIATTPRTSIVVMPVSGALSTAGVCVVLALQPSRVL